jgi:hypothetical protein
MQLALVPDDEKVDSRWEELPEPTRAAVLSLLARLIAKGVVPADQVDHDG